MNIMSEENKKELVRMMEGIYLLLKEADVPYQYEVAMKIASNADACAQDIVEQSIKDIKKITDR